MVIFFWLECSSPPAQSPCWTAHTFNPEKTLLQRRKTKKQHIKKKKNQFTLSHIFMKWRRGQEFTSTSSAEWQNQLGNASLHTSSSQPGGPGLRSHDGKEAQTHTAGNAASRGQKPHGSHANHALTALAAEATQALQAGASPRTQTGLGVMQAPASPTARARSKLR